MVVKIVEVAAIEKLGFDALSASQNDSPVWCAVKNTLKIEQIRNH